MKPQKNKEHCYVVTMQQSKSALWPGPDLTYTQTVVLLAGPAGLFIF